MKRSLHSFIKGTLLLLVLAVTVGACKNKKQNTPTGGNEKMTTTVEFRESKVDFGDLKPGEVVSHSFYFKNTGEQSFVITHIESDCGCTTADYPKKPVAPGKEEKIDIIFDSAGKFGKQYKEIRIFANLPEGEVVLDIIANVK